MSNNAIPSVSPNTAPVKRTKRVKRTLEWAYLHSPLGLYRKRRANARRYTGETMQRRLRRLVLAEAGDDLKKLSSLPVGTNKADFEACLSPKGQQLVRENRAYFEKHRDGYANQFTKPTHQSLIHFLWWPRLLNPRSTEAKVPHRPIYGMKIHRLFLPLNERFDDFNTTVQWHSDKPENVTITNATMHPDFPITRRTFRNLRRDAVVLIQCVSNLFKKRVPKTV